MSERIPKASSHLLRAVDDDQRSCVTDIVCDIRGGGGGGGGENI